MPGEPASGTDPEWALHHERPRNNLVTLASCRQQQWRKKPPVIEGSQHGANSVSDSAARQLPSGICAMRTMTFIV